VKRQLPPLNALRAFEAAARHLSFRRAARELGVTEGAVGHQVRALEAQLGLRLFARLHRGVALTEAGRSYLPSLRAAFDQIDQATRALSRGPRRLRVSVLPSFAARWLVPRLGAFRAKHRRIDLALHSSGAIADLARDPVDVAIRFGRGDYPGLHVERLLGDEIVVVASPRLADAENLRRQTLLHDESPDAWRSWLAAAGLRGVDAERGIVFDDASLLLQAAVDGAGVALARRTLAEAELRAGRLVRLFADGEPTAFAYWVACLRERAEEPAIRAFRRWLLAEAARSEGATDARRGAARSARASGTRSSPAARSRTSA
jgi:LysR family glycine cleavage system transcriptional activator